MWWRSPSCIYRSCRHSKAAECCSMETTGRDTTPIHAQTLMSSAASARATRVSHCQTHRTLFSHPHLRHFSPDLVCHVHRALFVRYYHHGSMHRNPRIDRQAQCGFCTRPHRKTGYPVGPSPLMILSSPTCCATGTANPFTPGSPTGQAAGMAHICQKASNRHYATAATR